MSTEIIFGSGEQLLTVGSRIKYIRNSQKMTQKRFAESLGIVQGFLSAIETSKKMPSDTLLIALQHLYKVNLDWIHSGLGENTPINSFKTTLHTENFGSIPLLSELPANTEEFQQSIREAKYISLPDVPTFSFAFKYSGDYMSPTVRDGDIVVIKPEETLVSGNIGLILGKWGEPLLRRYREINGEQIFSTDNSTYTPFHKDALIQVLGVVIKVWREIKI